MATLPEQTEIREGFLCPICIKDLGTIAQLQQHFEESHSNEDKAVINSIKDLFGKAKKKIMKTDPVPENFIPEFECYVDRGVSGNYMPFWEPQELGVTTSHSDYFEKIRSSRMDRFVVETNKLLIRLDNLISDGPSDPNGRKAYEKTVVYWVADSDVRLCPGCGRSFNISRRRHHCRLCGGIMCGNCSHFILFSYARKLTCPLLPYQSASQPSSPMHRSGSSSSLNSLLNAAGEPHIRICNECRILLDRRNKQIDQKNYKPVIMQLYERLKNYMEEAESLCPVYQNMADSLNAGEGNYHLTDAQNLRIKLIRLGEGIDLISKKIINLKEGSNEQPTLQELLLQKGIRSRCSQFLQENLLGLPSLPTEEELKTLQETRRSHIQRQIEEEKERALIAQKQMPQREYNSKEQSRRREERSLSERRAVSTAAGWGPDSSSLPRIQDNEDPMVQQIRIIKNYIRLAREAHKYDEVQMLEANLRELQIEYSNQQEQSNQQSLPSVK